MRKFIAYVLELKVSTFQVANRRLVCCKADILSVECRIVNILLKMFTNLVVCHISHI